MTHLTKFEETLFAVDMVCKNNSILYALIGGLAGIAHKLSRTTQDIDITLLVDIKDIRKIGEILLTKFIPLKENPLDFFEKYFVLPVYYKPTKIRIDFSAGMSGFDKMVIKRSKSIKFGNVKVSVCSIEDLIIYKIVASRLQDMADVEELFRIHYKTIDRKYLRNVAKAFIDLDRNDIIQKLERFFTQFHRASPGLQDRFI